MLSGCTTGRSSPCCESFNLRPPSVEANVEGDTQAGVNAAAKSIMQVYLDLSGDLSAERHLFNVPLLAGAGTAAGSLLFGTGQTQLDILKGVGLGVGLITATQAYLAPNERMLAYARAADAVACVLDAGTVLVRGEARRDALNSSRGTLQAELAYAANIDRTNATAGQIASLTAAQAAATAARDAINLELEAINSSVMDTKTALRSIITKVRNVILTARIVDFETTRDALLRSATQSAAAKAKFDEATAGQGTPSNMVRITADVAPTNVGEVTARLQTATNAANSELRFGFAQAKATLTGCSAKT